MLISSLLMGVLTFLGLNLKPPSFVGSNVYASMVKKIHVKRLTNIWRPEDESSSNTVLNLEFVKQTKDFAPDIVSLFGSGSWVGHCPWDLY